MHNSLTEKQKEAKEFEESLNKALEGITIIPELKSHNNLESKIYDTKLDEEVDNALKNAKYDLKLTDLENLPGIKLQKLDYYLTISAYSYYMMDKHKINVPIISSQDVPKLVEKQKLQLIYANFAPTQKNHIPILYLFLDEKPLINGEAELDNDFFLGILKHWKKIDKPKEFKHNGPFYSISYNEIYSPKT